MERMGLTRWAMVTVQSGTSTPRLRGIEMGVGSPWSPSPSSEAAADGSRLPADILVT
jgi:hypothetical protein